MDEYRSRDWASFRREVIAFAGGTCSGCGRSPAEGAVLQVHHREYIAGRKAWQYPHSLCDVVCRGCHAAEHGLIPPTHGWEHVGWDDLGGLDGACDYCGTEIRYVFFVQHPKWVAMEVGEVCCDNLTSTPVATDFLKARKARAHRLDTFLSSTRWTEHPIGNFRIDHKGACLWISPAGGGFKLCVNTKLGQVVFPTAREAKIKAFEVIEYRLTKRAKSPK